MDAGLAKVINSTIGTDSFRPLDKLLYGRQGLVPSENEYFKIGTFEEKSATVSVTSTKTVSAYGAPILSMKMWTDGGISLGATPYFGISTSGSWTMSISGGIAVFVNGTLIMTGTTSISGTVSGASQGSAVKCENIYFSAGDVVEIKPYISGRKDSTNSSAVDLYCKILSTCPIVVYANSVEKPFDITYAE